MSGNVICRQTSSMSHTKSQELKCLLSRLAVVVFVQTIEARC